MHIFLATSKAYPQLARHERLLVPALRAYGAQVEVAVWDDPGVAWGEADLVVVRTCWDYLDKLQAFLRWLEGLEQAGVRVANPLEVVAWNLSKTYLLWLEHHGGHRLPATLLQEPGTYDMGKIEAFVDAHPQGVVAKPVVSAGARDTWRIGRFGQDDAKRLTSLLGQAHQAMLLQEFLPQIVAGGEWSCVFFGGAFSHAVRKRPAPGDFRVQDDWGGSVHHEAAPRAILEHATGVMQTLSARFGRLLYARVDLVEDPSAPEAAPWVMECELIEPELFLDAPGAPGRLAQETMRFGSEAGRGGGEGTIV